ncbi:UTRA domain-containing protein [Rhodococcus sp. 1R11]|uniref:UTRA domain-containing protein n=1 Tax=Rhodococcus sp. 1R11 TaxID=2559614 RepID=UPI0024684287|nr:UTRA domain-containing protein [Rhodococcus sp. 1R11]
MPVGRSCRRTIPAPTAATSPVGLRSVRLLRGIHRRSSATAIGERSTRWLSGGVPRGKPASVPQARPAAAPCVAACRRSADEYRDVLFPASMYAWLLDNSLTGSLYDLLENSYGMRRGEALETVTAAAADRHQAAILQVPIGSSLLIVHRTAQLESGQIFEYSIEFYRADSVVVQVHTRAGATSTLQLKPS